MRPVILGRTENKRADTRLLLFVMRSDWTRCVHVLMLDS